MKTQPSSNLVSALGTASVKHSMNTHHDRMQNSLKIWMLLFNVSIIGFTFTKKMATAFDEYRASVNCSSGEIPQKTALVTITNFLIRRMAEKAIAYLLK